MADKSTKAVPEAAVTSEAVAAWQTHRVELVATKRWRRQRAGSAKVKELAVSANLSTAKFRWRQKQKLAGEANSCPAAAKRAGGDKELGEPMIGEPSATTQ